MVKRLTPEEVMRVPQLLNEGHNPSSIARELGVTPAAIRNVILEERWKRYVEEEPGKPDRCPDCGAIVLDDTKPCLGCEGRRLQYQRQQLRLLEAEKKMVDSPVLAC